MKTKSFARAFGGVALLMLVSGPAAAWICTGAGNEFQDANCDADEISAGMTPAATFDDTLLAKDDAPTAAGPGAGGSTQWGTLEVTGTATGLTGTVTFTWTPLPGITPQVIVEKADGWYSVYDWPTQITSLGGNLYSIMRFFPAEFCENVPNCGAETSHLSAYGPVPVPAAVWLLGGALVGLVGVARRKAA